MKITLSTVAAAALALLAGCGGGDLPPGVTEVSVTVYPATARGPGNTPETQDLLTAGLGKSGFALAAPAYADPLNPTVAELRRNAIYSNYRGLVDFTAAGGYGVFYGPNVGTDGVATTSEGLIPGREYLAVLDDGSGRKQVSLAVQVPDSFNPAKPCIVLGPSSGSRGVYGAIATSAEWGLKRGCAVALTDAGKGVGLYDPTDDTVNRVDGPRATRAAAGALATFAANISDAARAAFNAAFPNRLSIKQAHSQRNPEKDWGDDTLVAAAYAFYVINEQFDDGHPHKRKLPRFHPHNTVVIAGSVSNGGAAVVRAAEQDKFDLIDGVVAGEPVTEMPADKRVAIRFAGQPVGGSIGRPLADYVTYGNLYQPCALLAQPALMSEVSTFNLVTPAAALGQLAALRCAGLAAKGLVQGTTTAERAQDALDKLRAFGWTVEHDTMHNAHWGLGNGPILAAMYPMAYGRFGLEDNLCNTSFAQVNASGDPVAVNPLTKALSFAVANGTANGTPATVVYNNAVGGAKSWPFAVSPSTGLPDFGLDNALCQRALVTGVDETGAPLTDVASSSRPTLAQSKRVQQGIAEVLVNGKLKRTPTLIVAGRSDALVPVNHNARAYASLNRVREGRHSALRYIEVTNAQHFDGFLPFGGFDTRYVPLHLYWIRAMDAMWAHLTQREPLPPSQVVRTTPRGGTPLAAPALAAANVPPISAAPAAGDRIGYVGDAIDVPQ